MNGVPDSYSAYKSYGHFYGLFLPMGSELGSDSLLIKFPNPG